MATLPFTMSRTELPSVSSTTTFGSNSAHPPASSSTGLRRGLSSRHITFIGFGGGIGVGLFIGIGGSLAVGGPLSILLAYSITGFTVWSVVRALRKCQFWTNVANGRSNPLGSLLPRSLSMSRSPNSPADSSTLPSGSRSGGLVSPLGWETHLFVPTFS